VASTPWVAGLYADLLSQPPLPLRAAIFGLPEFEDQGPRTLPLPPVAEEFYNDLFMYRLWEQRAGLQGIAEFDGRPLAPPKAPSAFDEVEWQRFTENRFGQTTNEFETGLTPIVAGRAWDETEWQRAFAQFATPPVEDEQPERLPFTPPPVPNLGWDDFDWNHDFTARGLAVLLAMDDLVNAPLAGGTSGSAPRARAGRMGLGFPAFR
jgi:hypothetical protein